MRRHRKAGFAVAVLAVVATLGPGASLASAAGPPTIGDVWASSVFSTSARIHSTIDPNGNFTGYHVDYLTEADYEANVAASEDPFTGAARTPLKSEASVGSTKVVTGLQQVFSLASDTRYRYRVVASNVAGSDTSDTFTFTTQETGTGDALPDNRVWEMVSPVDKNGGQVDPPGTVAGGGVLQAAVGGGGITYSSSASFGSDAQGAPPASQYVSTRDASGNWSTDNITAPLFAGSFGLGNEGVPYQLFSGDLEWGLMLSGRHCRGEATDCAVANPPLPGTDAPAGYQNYYQRDSGGAFRALLGAANSSHLALEPADFTLTFAGSSTDLRYGALSTCAALTPNATEAPLSGGCDPNLPNLYEYSPTAGLTLVNVLPAQTQGTPGAALAAQSGAVSSDGSRVYWRALPGGALYLREGATTKFVDSEGTFETASADGSVAYFTKGEHLFRYEAPAGTTTDLTPAGGVEGVLGASGDGAVVYYHTDSGLFVFDEGTTTFVADDADASNYPPTIGTSRVSADGSRLLFMATTPLTGRDTTIPGTGELAPQVYLYASGNAELLCISCNPTFARPLGPSSIPGAVANGENATATQSYKPRSLSEDGRRVYFESLDALVPTDTNNATDVYQWEEQGVGSCKRPEGCLAALSGGRNQDGAQFIDASADGTDVFFLIDQALSSTDLPGSLDLYDARVNGRTAGKSTEIICIADACQPPAEEAVDPALGTLRAGPGNPPVNFQIRNCRKGFVKHRGRCVKKKNKSRGRKNAKQGSRKQGGRR